MAAPTSGNSNPPPKHPRSLQGCFFYAMMDHMHIRVRMAGTKRNLNLHNVSQISQRTEGHLVVEYPEDLADVVVPAGRWVNVERIH